MSFSSNGVKLNRSKRMQGLLWRLLTRTGEAVLSVLFVISLAGPMVFPRDAYAAVGVSQKLSYQGRLTDTNGNPYTGTYYVCFSIYDGASAGTKLWPTGTPTSNTVTVSNGVFNVGIGDADPLTFDFSTNDTVYLNVEVSSTVGTCGGAPFETLSPRQRMDATAYARVAAGVYGTALRTSSTAAGIGAGTGQATPIWLNLDWKNTATTLGGACPSGSVSGSVWYNSSGTRALACVNNVVVGLDNASEIAGIKEQSAGSAIASGVINFSGSNNITISQTGSTLQFSVPTPVQGFGMSNIGNTLGTSGTGTGTIVLAGGNNITLSQATGVGGQTITISAGAAGAAGATLSRWEYPQNQFTSLGAIGQGSLSIMHMYVPFNVTGTQMRIGGSLSAATNTSATTASANISLYMGIYTLNGSTLSLASSGSANNGFVWSQTASTTGNTSINSMRLMSVPININMPAGEYWVGAVISSATTYTSAGYTMYGGNLINNAAGAAVLSPIGSNTTAAKDVLLWQGVYTAVTNAMPVSIPNAAINNTGASNVMRANFYDAIVNATY